MTKLKFQPPKKKEERLNLNILNNPIDYSPASNKKSNIINLQDEIGLAKQIK